MYEKVTIIGKKIIPRSIFSAANPLYHKILSFISALIYRFPSNNIFIVGVTGTKGKSSTVELVNAILEEAGYTTALSGTVRFKIGKESTDNMYKMSMPGRFVIQKFLRDAVNAKCTYVVMEMTSQGVAQYRHKNIHLDALIFTNLSPEHIESHGSYENYRNAKLELAKSLELSSKKRKLIIVNKDDKEAHRFLAYKIPESYTFSLKDAEPYILHDDGVSLTIDGKTFKSPLPGIINIYNMLAAITFAKTQNISNDIIVRALEKFTGTRGRIERIDEGQNFKVIVDYAHTADSLQKFYQIFGNTRKICVLGNTGGGRDKWKRSEMAKVAEEYCDEIILTNEDPYDEDPRSIVEDMSKALTKKKAEIIMDRREAVASALKKARPGDAVLLTGKGTDPYIMGPNNSKIPWSDAEVAREEIRKILEK